MLNRNRYRTPAEKEVIRNGYIPRYIPPEGMDFCNYFEDCKYKKTMNNVDGYFQQVKIVNFDIIHHQCKNDPLEKSCEEHFSVKGSDFNCPESNKKNPIATALRNKDKGVQEINVEKNLSKSIFSSKNNPCKLFL